MPRALWKQRLEQDNLTRFAPYYEDTEAHDLMAQLSEACHDHLVLTSLEHLASASESLELPEDLLMAHDDGLHQAFLRLKQLFVRDFHTNNVTYHTTQLNNNELIFLVLMKYLYCYRCRKPEWAAKEPPLRYAPPRDSCLDLLDAKFRLAETMCVHGHLVHGVPYETRRARAQRRRDNRMDQLAPTTMSIVEWQRRRQEQEYEDILEATADARKAEIVRQAAEVVQKRHRRQREDEEYLEDMYPVEDEDVDDPTEHIDLMPPEARTDWSAPAPFPDVRAVEEEVAFYMTCYYSTVLTAKLNAIVAQHGYVELEPSPERQEAQLKLTNGAKGTTAGQLWSTGRMAIQDFLLMACQFFAQVWTEEMWRTKFPTETIAVSTRPFMAYVAESMSLELQETHVKEIGYATYSLLLPIGSKGLAKRVWGGTGSSMRAVVNKMVGSSVIHEIDEMFDTPAAMQLIGYDPHHPLQDSFSIAMAQKGCFSGDNDFSMVTRCIVGPDELMSKQSRFEGRNPVIVKLCGEWLVYDNGMFYKPTAKQDGMSNTFPAVWMTFLKVLKNNHKFAMDAVSNLSFWETLLRHDA